MVSKNLSSRSTLVGALLFLILGVMPARGEVSEDIAESETWEYLVLCVSQRTEECRLRGEFIGADDSQPSVIRRFAAILIEELQLPANHPDLMRPRKIWIPLPEPEEARQHLPPEFEPVTIVVQVKVGKTGVPLSARTIKSAGIPCLEEEIEDAALKGYYRPALDNGGELNEATMEFMYRIEPRRVPTNR